MDKVKANKLKEILCGKSIKGFKIEDLLNFGKSAAVFKAKKNKKSFALKVFDNELIENYGRESQLKRIQQEIDLKDTTIPNLVKIYDGGSELVTGIEYFFIVMEYINGQNLKEYRDNNNWNQDFVLKVLNRLFNVTNNLMDKSIVHRDIKPENVMIDENGEVVLMDLGVHKILGQDSFTDLAQKQFIGTLRYSPPEFLQRQEQDTIEGWRAINIYQIGGILYDLTQETELFEEKEHPYPVLVAAILDENPKVVQGEYEPRLISLIRNMLNKNWERRNKNCTGELIKSILDKPFEKLSAVESKKAILEGLTSESQSVSEQIDDLRRTGDQNLKFVKAWLQA